MGEQAPLPAATAVGLSREPVRRRGPGRADRLAYVVAAAGLAGYGLLAARGRRTAQEMEAALVDGLGADYRSRLGAEAGRLRAEVEIIREVPYAPGGPRFHCDVYRGRDVPRNAPVLLHLHGGGWVLGNRPRQAVPLLRHMAARGWVCVSATYPLSPKARWPEHLVAVKQVVHWIRRHGHRYGADPAFLAATGGSAGGHLAAMLALTAADPSLQPGFEQADTSVQACVPLYGAYELSNKTPPYRSRMRPEPHLVRALMPPEARYPEDYRAASPAERISSDAPPFLVVHGTNDSLIPVNEARAFVHRLRRESKNPVAYAELTGAQHLFDVVPSVRARAVVRGVASYLEWCRAAWAAGDY